MRRNSPRGQWQCANSEQCANYSSICFACCLPLFAFFSRPRPSLTYLVRTVVLFRHCCLLLAASKVLIIYLLHHYHCTAQVESRTLQNSDAITYMYCTVVPESPNGTRNETNKHAGRLFCVAVTPVTFSKPKPERKPWVLYTPQSPRESSMGIQETYSSCRRRLTFPFLRIQNGSVLRRERNEGFLDSCRRGNDLGFMGTRLACR